MDGSDSLRYVRRMPASLPFVRRVPNVPLVRIAGVVGMRPRPVGPEAVTAVGMLPVLRRAFSVRKAKAVALSINSPGGAPVQCDRIAREIRYLAVKHDLPVLAFVEDIAASGGYWLACTADEIFAGSSSIVGSIGVINASFGFPRLLERFGIERRIYAEGRHKGMMDPFSPVSEADAAVLQTVLKDIQADFRRHVEERRGARLQPDPDRIFSAAVWSGRRALELGLVDGLGDAGTVLRERFGEQVRIRDFTPKRRWFRSPLGAHGGAQSVAGLLEALEERALYARYGL